MIVPGQPISSYKKFEVTFQYKKGSNKESVREYNTLQSPTPTGTPIITPTNTPIPSQTPTPTPTPTPNPNTITFNIEVGNDGDFFRWGASTSEEGPTDVTIYWGDGSPIESGTILPATTENYQYNYPSSGNYTVSITFSDPLNVSALYADQND